MLWYGTCLPHWASVLWAKSFSATLSSFVRLFTVSSHRGKWKVYRIRTETNQRQSGKTRIRRMHWNSSFIDLYSRNFRYLFRNMMMLTVTMMTVIMMLTEAANKLYWALTLSRTQCFPWIISAGQPESVGRGHVRGAAAGRSAELLLAWLSLEKWEKQRSYCIVVSEGAVWSLSPVAGAERLTPWECSECYEHLSV